MPLRNPTLLLTGLVLGALMCSIGTALAGPVPGDAPTSSHIDVPISTPPTDPSPHGQSDVAFDAAPTSASGPGGFPPIAPGRVSGLSPPDLPLSRPGRFGWPLAPPHPVVRPFQPPATQYGPGHRGVDLGGQPGVPVLAAADGVVVFAGPLAGRGVVSIDHGGGLRTTYEPLTVLVSAGQRVDRGTVVGQLAPGHEGCVTAAACLHWGAHRGREYLDPLGLLSAGRVRLLPWEG
jgi:murein DD-endopeptidase MepM/ murein hydrolase activator NlpD